MQHHVEVDNRKFIWIELDHVSEPFKHYLDEECSCKMCESKIRKIIIPFAA
jgi:hypothetical protein